MALCGGAMTHGKNKETIRRYQTDARNSSSL
jgi:hypothetical protein